MVQGDAGCGPRVALPTNQAQLIEHVGRSLDGDPASQDAVTRLIAKQPYGEWAESLSPLVNRFQEWQSPEGIRRQFAGWFIPQA
jgi:hypothetical protein